MPAMAEEDPLEQDSARNEEGNMESMEQWEKAEQKLMFQMWKRREQNLKRIKKELEERTGLVLEKKIRFRSAACAVQYIQNQALMSGLIGSLGEKTYSLEKGSNNQGMFGTGGISKYKRSLEMIKEDPLDLPSKTASKTWEERKVQEIIAKQADMDALAAMIVLNTK